MDSTRTVTHTPGPWEADSDGYVYPEVEHGDYEEGYSPNICRVNTARNEFESGVREGKANARLIAAAPDLLKAAQAGLQALESHLDEACRDLFLSHRDQLCPCNKNEVSLLRAAIAKATGGE